MPVFESLTNVFVPDGKQPIRIYRSRIGKFQGWVSVIINTLLFIIKFAIGIIVGSISIMADAIHTLSDVISSGVVIWGFNEAEKPADKEHPYGHGRAEYISTLIIAVLLCVAGIEFIKASFERIINPEPIYPAWWMIIIIGATILLKELTARYAEFLSSKIASGTLRADAWHHRTDALSSLLVVVAMLAGKYGYYQLDGWAGLGVALFIIWTGIEIARDAVDDLLGKPPSEKEIEEIRLAAREVPGVLGTHDIAIHSYGKDKFVSIHIEIDIKETPSRAHDIAENVEEKLSELLGIEPTVHIDPINPFHPKVKEVQELLHKDWSDDKRIESFHDVRVVDTEKHHVILFGINVNSDLTRKSIIECCEELESSIISTFPDFEVNIKVSGIHLY